MDLPSSCCSQTAGISLRTSPDREEKEEEKEEEEKEEEEKEEEKKYRRGRNC